jgi:hypothetical protein
MKKSMDKEKTLDKSKSKPKVVPEEKGKPVSKKGYKRA